MGLLKIWNLKHKYTTTKTQFPIKVNGAQFSIKKNLYHQKILVIELDVLLRDLENTPMILDP
jgi:hypothetical protein